MKTKYWVFLCGIFCANIQAAPMQGIHFEHKDWETACDNTGTCRVAGYHHESEYDKRISVLFTRMAGSSAVSGELSYAGESVPQKTINLLINQKIIGKLILQHDSYRLSPQIAQMVIAATKGRDTVQIQAGKEIFTLSNVGAAAVWLKADEFQQFGKLKPQPKPLIKPAKTLSGSLKISSAEQNAIRQLLRGKINNDTCHELHESSHPVSLYRLNAQNVLAETECWRGAYNVGYAYAVLDNSRRQIHQIPTTDGSDYAKGVISNYHKSRGMGDCWSGAKYVWNGRRFVQTSAHTTGMCRGFAGGAWHLPTFVSDVK
ncbi:MAG: DUF1176 domain-containing protein [Alysiella sp.]|uniref:DUF1176 domain-containing protein n=1 Tax=Alysiella sp. TaxID=1872483 RepID=UPI0026DC248D|nr:DUF1176 domain-containing protein [Alysiella sp.]MDO4433603.1 DUF1176 domain-containing protein [Alysiella sp.]